MTICLDRAQIGVALPRIGEGLQQYLWLQSAVEELPDFEQDAEFRRRYNRFYRVRRGAEWQEVFYALMARAKKEQLQFSDVLSILHKATGRYEASFSSKLIATLDSSKPVIDRIVLNNVGLGLPAYTAAKRATGICSVYNELALLFSDFLRSESGNSLVSEFKRAYPGSNITQVKMLDLALWQTRD
jgi:hypothetical protein